MVKNYFFFPTFFLLLVFLIYFRAPCIFIDQGYWQIKEDSFYEYSLQNNFLKSALYVYDYGGYFEFTRNLITKLSTYFPVISQRISTYSISIIYLAIFSYIYFSKSIIFYNKNFKILFICLILFSPPMTPEIWLTPAHIKAYFGIFTFVLLFEDFDLLTNFRKKFYRFIIIFSGLSSIYASVLAPVFFLKFILEKKKDNFQNFLCSLLPLIINFFIFTFYSDTPDRFSFNFNKIESFAYNILIRPFFGSSIPKFFYEKLNFINSSTIIIALFLIIIFSIFFVYNVFKKRKDNITILIISSFILHSAFVLIGSLYPNFVGGRYAVIPGIILLTFFLRLFQLEKNYLLKYVFGFFILMSLITGFLEFKYFSPLPNIIRCINL
tara:strand:+ start:103 stop:1242 length:1140 start_codon:yes stop_codon:yes gene_type:complete